MIPKVNINLSINSIERNIEPSKNHRMDINKENQYLMYVQKLKEESQKHLFKMIELFLLILFLLILRKKEQLV